MDNREYTRFNSMQVEAIIRCFAKLQNLTIGYVMSVSPTAVSPSVWNNSAATGQIFVKLNPYPANVENRVSS
jgi:hypothetical protein